MAKRENTFQAVLIQDIRRRLPGCLVLKNDSSYIQGIPDLTVLFEGGWAVLECKRERGAARQPNQEYYVKQLDAIGLSRFVYPENREEVLNELEHAYKLGRAARVSEPKPVLLDL